MRRLLPLVLVFALGCAYANVDPDGDVALGAVGQAKAVHCPEATEEGPVPGCTEVEGGSFSDGFMKFLSDALTLIPRMLAGMAAGAATTQ